jgi:gliding motility-associated-like protein
MNRPILFFILIFHTFLSTTCCFSQNATVNCPVFQNPSFEGTPGISTIGTPWEFGDCDGSTPDTYSSTGGGSISSTLLPSNGNTYIGSGVSHPDYPESFYQKLSNPLSANTQYCFTIDLAASGVSSNSPKGVLEVYGANQTCGYTELLWKSPVISNTDKWQNHNICFTPSSSYSYVVFKPTCPSCASTEGVYLFYDNIQCKTVVSTPTVTVTGATICEGESATLTANVGGGTTPYKYAWSPVAGSASTIVVKPSATTIYTITVTDASGTTTTDTAKVTVGALAISLSPLNPVVCSGERVTLTASGADSYVWSSGVSSSSIVVNPPATTTYTVTGKQGSCSGTQTVTVQVGQPIVNITPSHPSVCSGESVTLTASGVDSYVWSSGVSSSGIVVNPPATTTYTVTGKQGSCSGTQTVTVQVVQLIVNIIPSHPSVCSGESVTLTASGADSYVWNTGVSASSIVVMPLMSTTYSITAKQGLCTGSYTVMVEVGKTPMVTISPNTTVCSNITTTLSAGGGSSYVWSTGESSSSISINKSCTGGSSLVETYTVTAAIASCYTTAITSLTVLCSPSVTITGDSLLCVGSSGTLTAGGGSGVYEWNTGSSNNPIVVTPSVSTTYTATLTDENGCTSSSQSMTVKVSPLPVGNIIGENICFGMTATLTAAGGGTYQWNTGATTQVINPATAGNYSVIVSVGKCKDTAYKIITIASLPAAVALSNQSIYEGQSANLSASGGIKYMWSNGMNGQNIVVSPKTSTVYCVTVYDANSCFDTACVKVTVSSCKEAGELFLPTAFSPNNDGENDYLQIYYGALSCIKSMKLIIHNRWGEKVYETEDSSFKWDGVYNSGFLKNGQLAGTEVYVYQFNAELLDGRSIKQKGSMTMVR